jgi:hypothetical protein
MHSMFLLGMREGVVHRQIYIRYRPRNDEGEAIDRAFS